MRQLNDSTWCWWSIGEKHRLFCTKTGVTLLFIWLDLGAKTIKIVKGRIQGRLAKTQLRTMQCRYLYYSTLGPETE